MHDEPELTGRTITVDRPVTELAAFWRERANLPLLFREATLDWSALRFTRDASNSIAWETTADAEAPGNGEVSFREAPAGRGIEVTLILAQEPRGPITRAVDKLTQHDPKLLARRALRRFKQLMETGEIANAARTGDAA